MIVNMRTDEPFDIRIDRATKWGNPFTHLEYLAEGRPELTLVDTREEAVSSYRTYMLGKISNGQITHKELARLHGKRLGCWCAPLACHGEVLVELAAMAHGLLNLQLDGED